MSLYLCFSFDFYLYSSFFSISIDYWAILISVLPNGTKSDIFQAVRVYDCFSSDYVLDYAKQLNKPVNCTEWKPIHDF